MMRLFGIVLFAFLLFCILLAADVFGQSRTTPAVIYVKTTGNDASPSEGMVESSPLKTIARAAQVAKIPGDTVKIYTGKYTSAIKIRYSGSVTQPIVFTEAPSQICTVSVASDTAISLQSVSYVEFHGLTIYGSYRPTVINNSSRVLFKQCYWDQSDRSMTNASYRTVEINACNYLSFVLDTLIGQTKTGYATGAAKGIGTLGGDSYRLLFDRVHTVGFSHYGISLSKNDNQCVIVGCSSDSSHGGINLTANFNGTQKPGRNLVAWNRATRHQIKLNPTTGLNADPHSGTLSQFDADSIIVRYNRASQRVARGGIAGTQNSSIYPPQLSAYSYGNRGARVYNNVTWCLPGTGDYFLSGMTIEASSPFVIDSCDAGGDRILITTNPTTAPLSVGKIMRIGGVSGVVPDLNYDTNGGTSYTVTSAPSAVVIGGVTRYWVGINVNITTSIGDDGYGCLTYIDNDKYLNNIVVGGYTYGLEFVQRTRTNASYFTHYLDANMVYGRAATQVRVVGVSTTTGTLASFVGSYPSQFGPNNVWAYPTGLDTNSLGERGGTYEVSAGSNVIDAGRWLAVVTATGTADGKTWAKLDDALWFCDGFSIIPADSIRVGTKDFLLERQGNDTLYFYRYDPVSIGDSVTVLSSWDGWKYQRSLSGDRPDIGAIEYGQVPAIPPAGKFSANITEISGPTSITFTWTTAYADSVYFEGVKVNTSDDTTFTVSATNAYDLVAYWDGGTALPIGSVTITFRSTGVTTLLTNGGFEEATGWSYYENGGTGNTYTRSTSTPKYGAYQARITFDDTIGTNNQLYTNTAQYIALAAGRSYVLSFWARSSAATDSFKVRVLDYTTPYTVYNDAPKISITSTYVQYADTFTCNYTDPTSYIQFLFYLSGQATYAHGAGNTIDIDSVMLYEVAPPDPPELTNPIGGEYRDSSNAYFNWSRGGPVANHIQIDNATDFATPVVQDSTFISTMYTATGLTKGATYYWRVRIKTSVGWSNWTNYDSMKVSIGAPSSAPLLLTPTSFAINTSLRPSLDWDTVLTATKFIYQISTNSEFTALVVHDSIGTTTPTWTFNDLGYSTTYYWRVRARNSAGYGPWSAYSSFTTGSRVGLSNNKRARVHQ